jgi:RNA polymerase sigma factor (sigma-70 family)
MGPCSVRRDDLADLLDRLRSGDPDAADAVAASARPHLEQLTRAYVRDEALREDIVQEALLEVLRTHQALRDPAAVRTWLRLIVRKHADRQTRRQRPTAPLDLIATRGDDADGPERLVERRGDVARIRRALEVAPDADALLLRLRYLGEWSDAELADLLRTSPGTVRKRLFDARRRMRNALSQAPRTHHPETKTSTKESPAMTAITELIGRVVGPEAISGGESLALRPGTERLETGLKILDAVVPIVRGGTVDLLGPVGLGQLVLAVEIAVNTDSTVVAAGSDHAFIDLEKDQRIDAPTLVIDGAAGDVAAAAHRAAIALAASGRNVILVLDQATWNAQPPAAGEHPESGGSVTAFRFAPHPRDGAPTERADDVDTSIVFSIDPFVRGWYPAIDVVRSRAALIEDARLDPVTAGAARSAVAAIRAAEEIRAYLSQPLFVAATFTGIPGERVAPRAATEELAALVR